MNRAPRRLLVVAAVLACAIPIAQGTAAATDPATQLAERYAPVLRLKAQAAACGPGEAFAPTDVDWLMGNSEVALRGPWQRGGNLVATAPSAARLGEGLIGYNLDYPGDALSPGCDYEQFSNRVIAGRRPVAYAHVARERAHGKQLSLQYWFFYLYNDFNNKHEGDWEMIQLVFDVPTVAAALQTPPTRVGYSQHEGAEEASWTSPKLQRVDGTHPVVYPAAGSHANYFAPALYLGRSAAQGVGCDDTEAPSREVRPAVRLIPTGAPEARAAYPWLAFAGRWGERQPGFYNGPTGPAFKSQWAAPITWADEDWRPQSFSIGAVDVLGPSATSFFCGLVANGSDVLTKATGHPWTVVAVLGAIALLVTLGASRTRWRPSTALRVLRRRAWGQIVTASLRLYREHIRLFGAIGLLAIPLLAVAGIVQSLLFRVFGLDALAQTAGNTNAAVLIVVAGIVVLFSVLALALVQAAACHAIRELDADRPVRPRDAYRAVIRFVGPLARADGILIVVVGVLAVSVVGLPVALWLLGRWAYATQVVVFEGLSGHRALRRSGALVRGHWFHASAILIAMVAVTLAIGPILGVLLLFATSAPFELVNIVSSLVYVATMPLLAVATTYVYANLRVAEATAAETVPATTLPAEVG